MSTSTTSNIEEIVLQLEEFSFFIKFRNHPKYLHYLNQLAKCVREKHYQPEQQIIKKGDQCDQLFFVLDGSIMIQSEYKVSRPISTSSSTQMLKNATISTITQQITKSRYQIVNKVKLASKYDVINEENALLSKLQSRENAICQTQCHILELNFSDFQRIFNSQVSEIRHRMSLFSKYFNFEEIDQSAVLSFCQSCTERSYICGDKLYNVGEKANGFYFVKSGTIEVSCNFNGGNSPKIIDLVSSTEFCGIEEIYNQNFNRVYDAFVQSEKAKILFIPISYFDPDRSFVHSDIGKMDLYKSLMRISKDKSKKYQSQVDKHREQINQQNQVVKIISREKSASQRVSIQEILGFENKANQKYRNSISETSQPNFNPSDIVMNPSFPCALPPKPNNNLNKSINGNTKSSLSQSSLQTVLKMKIRNSSQSAIKPNSTRQYNESDYSNKRSRADSMNLNQPAEIENQSYMFYQNTIQNEGENANYVEQLPIHSSRQQVYNGIASSSSLNCNYKVLFKKYLENKANKTSTQYPNVLNAPNQFKEKQLQILSELDQKIPIPKHFQPDEKGQPHFMISAISNNIKSLTKNQQEKQELEYGGTLFNNLMLSKSMKNPEDTNNNLLNETMRYFQKRASYNVNGKMRVTMTSFKSNKSLKYKENLNPRGSINTEHFENQQTLENDDSLFNLQTSEENSPLKKKYSFSNKDPKWRNLKGKQSFSDTKYRGSSLLDTSIQNEQKNSHDNNKKIIILQRTKRSITPLRQAQINLQPLNMLKQQSINYNESKQKKKTENQQPTTATKQVEKLKRKESEEFYFEESENSQSMSSLSQESSTNINYA